MRVIEQGLVEGLANPPGRMFLLCAASYCFGIFYILPSEATDAAYRWVTGKTVHSVEFVDFSVVPFLSSPFFVSGYVGVPVSFFCVGCSVLDRWDITKTTVLGAASTFASYFAAYNLDSHDLLSGLFEIGVYVAITAFIFVSFFILRMHLWNLYVDMQPEEPEEEDQLEED